MRPYTRVLSRAGTSILYGGRYASRGGNKCPSRGFFFEEILSVWKKFVFLPPDLTKINICMAILRSVFGSGFVKRIGNVIGQKAGGGKYRISAYQPDVANPRTVPQQTQRSKFSFLGKMAVLFGNEAMVGLSNTKHRTTQLAFISKNMPNVVMNVIGDPTTVSPTLTLRGIELSDGGVMTPVMGCAGASSSTIIVTADTYYGIEANRPSGIVVAAVCLSEVERPGYRAAVAYYDYDKYLDGVARVSGKELTVDVGVDPTPAGGHSVVVFAYNVLVPRSSMRTHYGDVGVYQLGGEDVFGAVDTVKSVSGKSLYSKTMHQILSLQ